MATHSGAMAQERGGRERTMADLVYVGFNSQVVALDRYTGEEVWMWKCPKRGGFVAILIDGDRIIASCNGYTYCLDPLFGQVVWSNELKGRGVGIPSVASVNGTSNATSGASAAVAAQKQRQQAAAAAAVT
ncbi:MAG TPA: PQQ-binding-like beta-propeller repeat protein [Phycisphaerales bacterium]|nr:PQQ-binding-like beta-propeller repeat protein [Phycisphaerales bacterium]